MFVYNGTYWIMMDVNRDNNDNTIGYYLRHPNGTYLPSRELYRYKLLLQKIKFRY